MITINIPFGATEETGPGFCMTGSVEIGTFGIGEPVIFSMQN
jgi:hypothetical protein